MRKIDLEQYPLCLALNQKLEQCAVGGTEAILEQIDLTSGKINKARVHCSAIEALCYSKNCANILSGSNSEIIKWKAI